MGLFLLLMKKSLAFGLRSQPTLQQKKVTFVPSYGAVATVVDISGDNFCRKLVRHLKHMRPNLPDVLVAAARVTLQLPITSLPSDTNATR